MCKSEYKITDGVPMSVCESTVCVCVCVIEVSARMRENRPSGSGLWTGLSLTFLNFCKLQHDRRGCKIGGSQCIVVARFPSGGAFTQISHPVASFVGHGLVSAV